MRRVRAGDLFSLGNSLFSRLLFSMVMIAIGEAFLLTVLTYFFGDNSALGPSKVVHTIFSLAIILASMGLVFFYGAQELNWGQRTRYAPPASFWWLLPPLVLASILYTLSIVVGLMLLIVPGIFAFFAYSYVPLFAVFNVGDERSNFRLSFELTKHALAPTILLVILSLLGEVPGIIFGSHFSSYQFLALFVGGFFSNYIQILFLALFHHGVCASEVGQSL